LKLQQSFGISGAGSMRWIPTNSLGKAYK